MVLICIAHFMSKVEQYFFTFIVHQGSLSFFFENCLYFCPFLKSSWSFFLLIARRLSSVRVISHFLWQKLQQYFPTVSFVFWLLPHRSLFCFIMIKFINIYYFWILTLLGRFSLYLGEKRNLHIISSRPCSIPFLWY